MSRQRAYVRPMDGWWRRDPYFVRYMAREATSVFVAAYAVVLLIGLIRLSQGETAYGAWLAALKSPLSILMHVVFLATFIFHTWSWFRIMPKTLPILFLGGKRVAPAAITATGIAAALLASVAVILFARG